MNNVQPSQAVAHAMSQSAWMMASPLCSLISGTIFESSKLALPKWFVAMHLITQAKNGVSALELKRHVGVSWPTAWMMKHKILQVMFEREDSRQLSGRVEIDDAYLGGEHHGGKPGRGSPNKVPFVAAVQTTESGEAMLMCLAQCPFTKEAIGAFAAKSLAAPATLVSDGLGCFTAVRGTGIASRQSVQRIRCRLWVGSDGCERRSRCHEAAARPSRRGS